MPPTALTIGNFDGVHVGHAALVRRARELAGPTGRVIALAFEPHPMTRLRPEAAPARLSSFEQREAWLHAAGADLVDRLMPDEGLLSLSPEDFVKAKIRRHSLEPGQAYFVEGTDFHFGKGRAGNVRVLAELGARLGFVCDVVPPVEVALSDLSVVRASSSLIRWTVKRGRMNDAARMLGRPYEIAGQVVPGDRRGRTIGFPTANVKTEHLLPADGVYACEAVLPDGRALPAAGNVGTRPTFDGLERRLEVYVLAPGRSENGHGGDGRSHWSPLPGLAEYGWPIRVRLLAFVRDDLRFDSVQSLIAQIERDCERVRERLEIGAG